MSIMGEKCDVCGKKEGSGAFRHGMHFWKGKVLCDECFLIDRLKEILDGISPGK